MTNSLDHPRELFDLTGHVAVVTGGSRGIGSAIAGAYARAGADVVIASRKLDSCVALARRLGAETGRRVLAQACHVGRWDDCDELVDVVYREFGRCDVLVNNAGMSPHYDSLEVVTEEYWDKVSAVNLKGAFRLSTQVGTRMKRSGGGAIINVSSIGSLRPRASELVYACAKAGLNALTIGLADAYGPTVRANGILPGPVETDISKGWTEENRVEIAKDIPLGRIGQPQDVVGAALWLAAPASAWVSGILVRVDGGAYRQT